MFKKLITEDQKREIEKLAENHCDALIAYGADMHRRGIIRGAICTYIGLAVGYYGAACIDRCIKKHKSTKEEKES